MAMISDSPLAKNEAKWSIFSKLVNLLPANLGNMNITVLHFVSVCYFDIFYLNVSSDSFFIFQWDPWFPY